MAGDTAGLMEALAIDRAHVLGGSMGGMIAQQNGIGSNPEVFFPRLGLSAHDYLWWTSTVCHPPEFIAAHPEIVERKIQANLAYPCTLAAYEAQLEAFTALDVDGRLNTIHVPTMVIIGNQDLLTPPPNSFLISRRIPGAQICEIDGAGHIF
jgi:pimeloyl-ACP methyl ester carboxylesterase